MEVEDLDAVGGISLDYGGGLWSDFGSWGRLSGDGRCVGGVG